MFDATPGRRGETVVFETKGQPCRRSSPAEITLRVAEKVRASQARIKRQMSQLPVQAERWRTAATELNVNAALSNDPRIQSAMFRISDRYVRMAHSAEISYRLALAQKAAL
jgi:hypothetical protein